MMLTSFAWAYDFEKDGICYNILSEQDKTVEVAHDYYTYKGDVVIPSEVNGYSVVGIADHAFEGSFSLKSITIPKSILHIGNAFWATDSLSSIIVDKENPVFDSRDNCNAVIETASNRLVVGCRSTIIPNGITSIGKLAFQGCKIQSIELPNSLVRIEDEAFYSSTIKTISIPDNVTEIGESAFWYCDSLASIKLPLNLKTLGVGAFEDCYTLTSISIPDGVTEISDSLFCGCSNLKNVIMPNSVTSIGKCAFQGCYKIENISIPSETTIINDSAFYVPEGKQDRLAKVYDLNYKTNELKEVKTDNLLINYDCDKEPAFASGGAGVMSTLDDYAKFAQMLLNKGTYESATILKPATVNFMTHGKLRPECQADMNASMEHNIGFTYANLLRIMDQPSIANTLSSKGEYGWDGWLGPYFENDPAHNLTILFGMQKIDAGTWSLTRKLRNVIFSELT